MPSYRTSHLFKILLICFAFVMASQNPEAQEATFKDTQKQEEGGETSNMPVQEKNAAVKQGFANLPAVFLYDDHGREQYHLLRLPAGGRTHTMNNKPNGLPIGSVEGGWLILYDALSRLSDVVSGYEDQILCYNYISFLNPLSGAKLHLPSETCFLTREDYKRQSVADVITSNCSPDSPEFLVVAFFLNSNRHWLAFCRIEDESWTHIADIKHTRDASILIQLALALDDKNKLLYFLHLNPSASNNYDMMAFDLKDSKNIKRKRLVMTESNTLPREGIFTPATNGDGRALINLNTGDRRLYLAVDSSCGDFFMVLQKNDVEDGSTNILPVKSFRVFIKLDEGRPQWKEIHDLGNRSIFISHSSASRVIPTAELNVGSKSEEGIFRGNCIYFAVQNSYQTRTSLKRDVGVFSLADRRIQHFHLPWKFQKAAVATLWWFDFHRT